MTKNKLFITGRVITQFSNSNGSTSLTVVTKNGRDVYLRILAPPGIKPELPHRAHVTIEGHFESFFSKKNNRNIQQLVADRIDIQKTMTEESFGVKGKFYDPFSCKAEVAGTVKKIIDDNDWVRYVVGVDEKNNVFINMRKLDRQPNIEVGSQIYAVCAFTSVEKEFDGKTTHIENVIVHDLATQ